MHFDFADTRLESLYTQRKGAERYPAEVIEAFLKRVRHIEAASNEADLRVPKSVHFEKLLSKKYAGKHSMRLNQQWRLILSIEQDGDGKFVRIHEITKHYGD